MAQLLKKVTEVEVREALPPAQFAKLAKTANLRDQKAVKSWDDGVYDGVVNIVANVNKSNQELVSIQFTYSNDESMEIECAKHGGDGDDTKQFTPVSFTLDEDEHIFKVKAVYDPTNAYYKTLIFYTNKDKIFDTKNGESKGSVTGDKTIEMVGFQGEADANHLCKMSFHKH